MIFLTTYPIVMLRALYCMIERLFPPNYSYMTVIKYCLLRKKLRSPFFLQDWVSGLYVPLMVSGSAYLSLDSYRNAKERKIESHFKLERTSGSHLIKPNPKPIWSGPLSKLDLSLELDCVDQSLVQSSPECLQERRLWKLFNQETSRGDSSSWKSESIFRSILPAIKKRRKKDKKILSSMKRLIWGKSIQILKLSFYLCCSRKSYQTCGQQHYVLCFKIECFMMNQTSGKKRTKPNSWRICLWTSK